MDLLLFGRITYQLMAGYWPTPAAGTNDPVVAERMNHLAKVVCSRTLKHVDWKNTRLVREHVADEVKLKAQPGKGIGVLGSSNLAATLIHAGLIDEYRFIVSPIILGAGRSLLKGLGGELHLGLVRTQPMASGNVVLYYQNVPWI